MAAARGITNLWLGSRHGLYSATRRTTTSATSHFSTSLHQCRAQPVDDSTVPNGTESKEPADSVNSLPESVSPLQQWTKLFKNAGLDFPDLSPDELDGLNATTPAEFMGQYNTGHDASMPLPDRPLDLAQVLRDRRPENSPQHKQPNRVQDAIKDMIVNIARERNLPVPGKLQLSDQFVWPMSLVSLYYAPMRRPPTHGNVVANLQIRSYTQRNLEMVADFALRAAYYLGMPAKGPVPLPRRTERWTVIRGNFVHKKSQQNFERVTYKRLIQIQDSEPESIRRWLGFIRKHQWYGVGFKCDVFEQEDVNVAARMDATATQVASQVENVDWSLIGRRRDAGVDSSDFDKLLLGRGIGLTPPDMARPDATRAKRSAR